MKRREDNPPMDKPRKESLILSYTRNQRRWHQHYAAQDVCKYILDELRPGAKNKYM